jgi:hypothetical protein
LLIIGIVVALALVTALCVMMWRQRQQNKDMVNRAHLVARDNGGGGSGGGHHGSSGGGGITNNPVFEWTDGATPSVPSPSVTVYKTTGATSGDIDGNRTQSRPVTVYKTTSTDTLTGPVYHDIDEDRTHARPVTVYKTTGTGAPTGPVYHDIDVDAIRGAPLHQPRPTTVYVQTMPGNPAVLMPASGVYGKMNAASMYATAASSGAPVGGGPDVYSQLEREASTVVFPPTGEYAPLNPSTMYATPAASAGGGSTPNTPNVYSQRH